MVFDFGAQLKQLRQSKKMTQLQVAKRLHLSKTSISGYENNIKTPSLDVLVQLSKLYQVTTDYLLGLDTRCTMFADGLTKSQLLLLQALLQEFQCENGKMDHPN